MKYVYADYRLFYQPDCGYTILCRIRQMCELCTQLGNADRMENLFHVQRYKLSNIMEMADDTSGIDGSFSKCFK